MCSPGPRSQRVANEQPAAEHGADFSRQSSSRRPRVSSAGSSMLFADKQALERQLEVDLLNIRQRELDHYVHCCLTLSAPAALIAGFAYTGLSSEIPEADANLPHFWIAEGLYYVSALAAMVFEVAAVVKATLIALLGPHLALRGPPGSVARAVEQMEPAYMRALKYFWCGLFCFHISAALTVWLRAELTLAFTMALLILATTTVIGADIRLTLSAFHLPSGQAVTGGFDFTPDRSGRKLGVLRQPSTLTSRSLIARMQSPSRARTINAAAKARARSPPGSERSRRARKATAAPSGFSAPFFMRGATGYPRGGLVPRPAAGGGSERPAAAPWAVPGDGRSAQQPAAARARAAAASCEYDLATAAGRPQAGPAGSSGHAAPPGASRIGKALPDAAPDATAAAALGCPACAVHASCSSSFSAVAAKPPPRGLMTRTVHTAAAGVEREPRPLHAVPTPGLPPATRWDCETARPSACSQPQQMTSADAAGISSRRGRV